VVVVASERLELVEAGHGTLQWSVIFAVGAMERVHHHHHIGVGSYHQVVANIRPVVGVVALDHGVEGLVAAVVVVVVAAAAASSDVVVLTASAVSDLCAAVC
jgi:hypothetical protein